MSNVSFYGNESYAAVFIQSVWSKAAAGTVVFISIAITIVQIFFHLHNYTCSKEQRWIVRILFIVPIYGLHSFFSLIFLMYDSYVYFNAVRDVYEAFVIYSFLSLCYVYLAGESNILAQLSGKCVQFSIVYCTCCFAGHPYTVKFLRFCKQATLQFCFVKPVVSILVIVLQSQGLYAEGNFSPKLGYIYITVVYNISITIALYGLLLFYFACQEMLRPFDPVLKFITVKSVIFLSFWQGVSIAIMEKVGIIRPMSSTANAGTVSAGIQNFLICMELILAAIALWLAFPYKLYSDSKIQKPRSSSSLFFTNSLDHMHNGNVNSVSYDNHGFSDSAKDSKGYQLQTLSARFRDTVNPMDIVHDAVINFHPTYMHYAQQTQTD